MVKRPGRRVRHLSGAVSGQLSQAMASFALQLVAAHALGATGLGQFALVLSAMLTTTALCNGLVGDSLIILDRGKREVRAALQAWCLISSAVVSAVIAVVYVWAGVLDSETAIWFALANMVFLVESVLRLYLVAIMRFWSLVVVDLGGLAASLAVLLAWRVNHPLTIEALLVALLVGQIVGVVVAVLQLPRSERWLAPWRPAAMREVAAFGSWRAIQQGIRPTMLTVGRLIVTAAVGSALFGQMEAGRVYMSPALLVVGGLGSYLFSSYAQTKDQRWVHSSGGRTGRRS